MFFKDFVSVKRKKIKKGASQTYDTPSFSFFHTDHADAAIHDNEAALVDNAVLARISC
jgi:hypothetical protein